MDLNIGCGESPIFDALGIDICKTNDIDILGDTRYLPFTNSVFDTIYLDNVVEHIERLIELMEEIYRVSKPDALIHIWVPYGTSRAFIDDPTHRTPINENTFEYFHPSHTFNYYTESAYEVEQIKYKFWKHPVVRLLKVVFPLTFVRDFIPNAALSMYIRLRCLKNSGEQANPTKQPPNEEMEEYVII